MLVENCAECRSLNTDGACRLGRLAEAAVATHEGSYLAHGFRDRALPSRARIIALTESLLAFLCPGFFEGHGVPAGGSTDDARHELHVLHRELTGAICSCLRSRTGSPRAPQASPGSKAEEIALDFLECLPRLQLVLHEDILAAYDGDPAAESLDEIVLAYPGVLAVTVYRLAHELLTRGVSLMPRIMTEWAHSRTGIDIHPGATIGRRFFIDHGTGVVIGQTALVGNDVKIYQGVTVGALSIPRDEQGQVVRNRKRHPTIGDNVTLYANATVLGGGTVIGDDCIIGGSVFLTTSTSPSCVVNTESPVLKMRARSDSRIPHR